MIRVERALSKLKRLRAVEYEKMIFNKAILPAHTEFLGVFNNNNRLADLLIGAKFFQFDPVLGHRYRKNSATLLLRQNDIHVEKYLCITDRDGFVPNALTFQSTKERLKAAKMKGMKSIFILGGSTVAHCSGYLPDTEIAAHLEKKLHELYPEKYIVINAGTGGYASDNQFKYLAYEILPLQPDIVIFYDGWNDCAYLNGLLTTYQDHYKRGSVQQCYGSQILYENSMSVMKMTKQRNKLLFRLLIEKLDTFNLLSQWMPKFVLHPIGEAITRCEFTSKSVDIYGDNIYMAHALCKAYGTTFLHFLQPLLLTGKKPLTKREEDYLNNIPAADLLLYKQFYDLFEQRQFTNAERFQTISSYSLRTLFDQEKEFIYKDAGHIESNGNQIVAACLANYIH